MQATNVCLSWNGQGQNLRAGSGCIYLQATLIMTNAAHDVQARHSVVEFVHQHADQGLITTGLIAILKGMS